MEEKKQSAAKLVSSAILGMDFRVCVIGGKRYVINPPTIGKLAAAAYYLDECAQAETLADVITNQQSLDNAVKALSYLIAGDDHLAKQLKQGTVHEVVEALRIAYEMLSVQDFLMLSTLARNVAKMAANQRQ